MMLAKVTSHSAELRLGSYRFAGLSLFLFGSAVSVVLLGVSVAVRGFAADFGAFAVMVIGFQMRRGKRWTANWAVGAALYYALCMAIVATSMLLHIAPFPAMLPKGHVYHALVLSVILGLWIWSAVNIPLVIGARRAMIILGRIAAGHCATCNYDLRATDARCPECGTDTELRSLPGSTEFFEVNGSFPESRCDS